MSQSERVRMTGPERREQLLGCGRQLFAAKGFAAVSVEMIAQHAGVTKPVVYEHFGGKEGLYEVVVERETAALLDRIGEALVGETPRLKLEQAADAFLSYIEEEQDGFRVLTRDVPAVTASGSFGSLIGDIASQVEHILVEEFRPRDLDPAMAPLYSRALVGMVALVGQWWLEAGRPRRDDVAAHLVNIAWNGLSGLDKTPDLRIRDGRRTA